MKKLFSLAALAAAAFSHASFELMFVSDNAGRQIRRVDAVTGASFGTFGTGMFGGGVGRTYADKASGIIYCGDLGGRVVKFNYSTGEFAGSFAAIGGYQMVLLQDGTILTGGEASQFYRYSSTGTLLTTFSSPSAISGLTQAANGFIYASTSNGSVYRFAPTGGAGTLVTTFAGNWLIGIKAQGNRLAMTSFQDNGFTATFDVNAAGNMVGTARTLTLLASEPNAMTGREVAFGHSGLLYVLGDDGTAGKNYAYTWDPTMSSYARKLDLGVNQTYGVYGLSTVVAPEPGTWLAITAGLALVARRRRNKR